MLVGSKPSVREYILSAPLNQIRLTPTNEIKLLGINIDCHLNWKNHIKLHCKSISPKVGLLHRLSRLLPKKQLIIIYTSIIQSCLDYVLSFWGACHKTFVSYATYSKISVHAYVPIILIMTFFQ